jgi:predicted transcriptional regulator
MKARLKTLGASCRNSFQIEVDSETQNSIKQITQELYESLLVQKEIIQDVRDARGHDTWQEVLRL